MGILFNSWRRLNVEGRKLNFNSRISYRKSVYTSGEWRQTSLHRHYVLCCIVTDLDGYSSDVLARDRVESLVCEGCVLFSSSHPPHGCQMVTWWWLRFSRQWCSTFKTSGMLRHVDRSRVTDVANVRSSLNFTAGRLRIVVLLGPLDPEFELFFSSHSVTTQKASILKSASYFLSLVEFEDSDF